MTYEISKTFEFSASHVLAGLPDGHQCGRLHGHNYTVRVELSAADLDTTGFVVDYGSLAPFKAWIDANLDHRHLNEQPALHGYNPTAEYLARMLHDEVTKLLDLPAGVSVAVAVSETPKTWARYRP